jgi:hypothetical protein
MRDIRARGASVLMTAVVAVVLTAPAGLPAQTRQTGPELAALVPRLDAWASSEAPRSYFPDNLYEYIDGAAESYLSYDFRELLVVDLEKKGTDATLTLEIYDMGDPVNAFGIFGAERYPENKVAAIGELGYIEGEALNFLAGRFYVKMLAFGLGEGTEGALMDVGARVAGGVKPGGGLPAPVLAFPKENLVARSEKYIKKNFMGYEFLHDGFVASYKAGDKEMEGFLITAGSDKDAEAMLAKLVDTLTADKQVPEKTAFGWHVKNRYGQHLYIGRSGGVLCGAMRVPDGLEAAGEALLRVLTMSLAERGPKK